MRHKYNIPLILLILLYTWISFSLPVNYESLHQLHISLNSLRVIDLALFIPIFAIWYIAFYGFSSFKIYAEKIENYPDGKGFSIIADGLVVIGLGLILTSFVSSAVSYFTTQNLGDVPRAVIVSNYVSVLVPLLAFTFIFVGARNLIKISKIKFSAKNTIPFYLLVIILGVIFAWVAIHNPAKDIEATATRHGLYYLPNYLIVITIVIPYIISWFLGIKAAFMLNYYKNKTKGIIYKRSLSYLSRGVILVVISEIATQFLNVFNNEINEQLNQHGASFLGPILLIIYVLLVLIAAGYVLIAMGAKELNKIEVS